LTEVEKDAVLAYASSHGVDNVEILDYNLYNVLKLKLAEEKVRGGEIARLKFGKKQYSFVKISGFIRVHFSELSWQYLCLAYPFYFTRYVLYRILCYAS